MKLFCKLLLCATALAGLLLAPGAAAAPARPAEYFVITDYRVDVQISEGNVYDISEIITVQFSSPRYGIYRDIPVKGTLYRQGVDSKYQSTKFKASVSQVNVQGHKYSVSREGSYQRIRIGDPDAYVDGEQVYRISYRWNPGGDGIPDFDEVYFNIIGAQWDTTIDRVAFTVTLPHSFDASLLGLNIGRTGSSGYDPDDVALSVDGNTVSGSTKRQLSNYEAITMRVQLPQGYFKTLDPRLTDWAFMGLIALLAMGSVVLFFLFGRDDKPVKTVEFYAPEGLTPSEVGYIIDGSVDNHDVVSLVLYWADKGYLGIEDEGKNVFRLNKRKEMGKEAKAFERHMFGKLFKDGPSVTTGDLQYTFYSTVNSTKAMVADTFESKERRVFTKASTTLKPFTSLLTALPVMMTLALSVFRDTFDVMETALTAGIIGALILLPVFFLIGTMRLWRGQKPAIRIIKLISFLFLCLIAVVFYLFVTESILTPLRWLAVLATVFIGLVSVFIIKRTPRGVEWLGKIQGFRDFIQLAERDKLIALVEQNPSYFYNVLPYAWVLNVTDKWAKKFETIAMQPPQWYSGYSGQFHPVLFTGSLSHSMNTFQTQMTSTPSSSGGGGSGGGGGGFSGGGGGGGGGGSW